MGVPFRQQLAVGSYVIKQMMRGRKRYPLVLMLEPLFRCNLACAGCGKIDYPNQILKQSLTREECLEAVDECGAPVVSIAGGEPLLHKQIGLIVQDIIARGKFIYLCTNALLLEKKLSLFTPGSQLTFSVHLDGLRAEHDRAVCQSGVFDRAVSAIKAAKARGFQVNCNTTIFDFASAEVVAEFLDFLVELKVDGVTISPGYAYERAPDQQHFLNRRHTKQFFRKLFQLGRQRRDRGKKWPLSHSSLYLDFLAGNQRYQCTPWGNPTRTLFGWQRPCYLLGEGYANTFRELMEDTNWEDYGTGRYEKCADCMAHCGYEASAVADALAHPFKLLGLRWRGVKTSGGMAEEIPLAGQRPARFVFDQTVSRFIAGSKTGST